MLLEFDGMAWLLGGAALIVMLALLRRRGWPFLFFFSIFWVYLLALLSVTLFPIPLWVDAGFSYGSPWEQVRFMLHRGGMNLVPLHFGSCWRLATACYKELIGNILMTIPFGFGFNFLRSTRLKEVPLRALGLGLAIETAQLMMNLALGVSYRTVDINDVLLNGLGFCAGYVLFLGFAWVYMFVTHRWRLIRGELAEYLAAVCQDGLEGTRQGGRTF